MSYLDDVNRIAQQAADDYPDEEARNDRYIFIEQETYRLWPSCRYTCGLIHEGHIQDAVERLLERQGHCSCWPQGMHFVGCPVISRGRHD